MELGLEQLVDFPTRLENTLDLIFTSHPSFKIRCKPLPPIGQKSDRDIFFFFFFVLYNFIFNSESHICHNQCK